MAPQNGRDHHENCMMFWDVLVTSHLPPLISGPGLAGIYFHITAMITASSGGRRHQDWSTDVNMIAQLFIIYTDTGTEVRLMLMMPSTFHIFSTYNNLIDIRKFSGDF